MSDALFLDRPADGTEDGAKWRQIVDGARKIFLSRGFDAASMGDIAKAAGVSKGTLYVYFKDKDELFAAIVRGECIMQADGVFDFDHADHDVEAVLLRHGKAFVAKFSDPGRMSTWRTVIAIAERMPDIGRKVYETGPAVGLAKLTAYLRAQVDAGVLAIEDCEVAAAQFIETCHATMFKPVLFNFAPAPTPERIDYVVGIAVRTFLAAYRAK
ncbi:MAG: TetR/AcrR family transcriptional regulator [Pseudolabrys sp.]|jgi:AcrR family transcriptional regulator|nr:TetR/AcrR family transcriptional regulator [Pseudolabrys sp.]